TVSLAATSNRPRESPEDVSNGGVVRDSRSAMSSPDPGAISAIALLVEPTRRSLYDLVAGRSQPIGRDQAATALGISRELAALHLDRLAAAGLVTVEYRRLGARRGPGAGRPAKLYRRSSIEVEVSLPMRDYERIALLLADAVVDDGASGSTVSASAGAAA